MKRILRLFSVDLLYLLLNRRTHAYCLIVLLLLHVLLILLKLLFLAFRWLWIVIVLEVCRWWIGHGAGLVKFIKLANRHSYIALNLLLNTSLRQFDLRVWLFVGIRIWRHFSRFLLHLLCLLLFIWALHCVKQAWHLHLGGHHVLGKNVCIILGLRCLCRWVIVNDNVWIYVGARNYITSGWHERVVILHYLLRVLRVSNSCR